MHHIPTHDIAEGVEVSAPVMIDNAFGISCGAGGVIERDGIPFILGQGDRRCGITGLNQVFIGQFAKSVSTRALGVLYIDDENLPVELAEGFAHHRSKLRIRDQGFGLAVVENEREGGGIETDIEGV